jgi:hypothetical protein
VIHNGILEILETHQFPGTIIRSGKTEQRQLEDESARSLLQGCKRLEEQKGTNFMAGSGVKESTVKKVWEAELADTRKTSITDRYDERMKWGNDLARKMEEADGIPTIAVE